MNEKNTKKLNDDFPRIFPTAFSFECSDGWFDLIHKLCTDIEIVCEKLKLSDYDWPHASQIKEKYGGLRFYTDSACDAVYDLIEAAERTSLVTCECCGLPGKTREGGWIRTLCDTCEKLKQTK
jgi:hypothetical protein